MNNAGIIDAMTYDANGNPTRVENDSTAAVREMYWDEDNRLMVLLDNGRTSRYTYKFLFYMSFQNKRSKPIEEHLCNQSSCYFSFS